MTKLAFLMSSEEGFGRPGKIPTVRHNPGDLRHSPHSQHPGGPAHKEDIGTIDTNEHGWQDLERQLQLYAKRGLNLQQAIYAFAPAADGNDPARYLAGVLAGFKGKVKATTPLAAILTIQV
jgi:hypothetical protein